jgi:chromate transporter
VIVGRKFQGWMGSVVASVGLMLMPLVIVLVLAALYAQFANIPAVRGASTGVSAAAAGLILSVAMKMARPMRQFKWQLVIAAIVLIAIGLVRIPLWWMLVVMTPVSLAIARRRQ